MKLNKKYIIIILLSLIITLIYTYDSLTIPQLLLNTFLSTIVISSIISSILNLIISIKNKNIKKIIFNISMFLITIIIIFLITFSDMGCMGCSTEIGQHMITDKCEIFSDCAGDCKDRTPWYYNEGCNDPEQLEKINEELKKEEFHPLINK